jgi:uncharacterized protein
VAPILKQFHVSEKDLKKLCQRMGVKSLSVFGSATENRFKPGTSDIDFLVEFESVSIDQFFEFLDGLQKLFRGNKIDLVTMASLKNPIIREEILSSQQKIYAA